MLVLSENPIGAFRDGGSSDAQARYRVATARRERPRRPAHRSAWLAASLLLGAPATVSAQASRHTPDLEAFRAAFASAGLKRPAVAIAVVAGEPPVMLFAGNDASGQPIGEGTLLPLGCMAKLLAADALHVRLRGEVDRRSGVRIGERELSVRELIEGVALLPDYFVADGGQEVVDAKALLACAEVASRAEQTFGSRTCGFAEFVLVERVAFAGETPDWPKLMRTTLAAHVPGLDPKSADALNESERKSMLMPSASLAHMASAQPPLIRTLVSARELAAWWQWRIQQEITRWEGPRAGRTEQVPDRGELARWVFHGSGSEQQHASIYPGTRAGVVCLDSALGDWWVRALEAFEDDLLGTVERAEAGVAGRFGGRRGGTPLTGLEGLKWRTAPAAPAACRIEVVHARDNGLVLECGRKLRSTSARRVGKGLVIQLAEESGTAGIWSARLLPQPDFASSARLSVVLIEERAAGASVPRCFDLEREEKK